MDTMELRKALAMLQSLRDELPKEDLERKYVELFHSTLYDIERELGQDLDYFHIPLHDLYERPKVTGIIRDEYGESHNTYDTDLYCERARFLISLRGAINFINSLILDNAGVTIRLIEPEKPSP